MTQQVEAVSLLNPSRKTNGPLMRLDHADDSLRSRSSGHTKLSRVAA